MRLREPQAGAMLLEALIGILIFSMGILAIVGLLAASTKSAGDAKYRMDASQLSNQLVGQMLGSINRSTSSALQLVALQNNFSSPNGAAYTAWLGNVTANLPGAVAVPPTVVIIATPSTSLNTPSSQATITISWNAPNEAAGAHVYTTVAQIR